MNPIRNPFSRDEYPALTDAINGVVNGQPRPVEDPITEDAMTAERDAELRGKMKREKDYGEYRKLRAQREKEAKSKKLYGKGGKIDTSRKPDVSKSKQIWEAESPTEGKKPSNPFNPTLGDLLKSKQQNKKADAKRKGVQESQELDERLVGGADFLQASKNLLTGKGFKTNREVSGARVNANMAAMQRRKARAAKKKG